MTPLRALLLAGLAIASASTSALAQPATLAVQAAAPPDIEPDAVRALARMTAYLGALTAFEVRAETRQDLVMTDGQKVTLDGVNRYRVRRPDAFMVEVATIWKVRRLIYDGRQLTLEAPELGYYSTVEAPATIRATLDAAEARYGLHVPLQDLFRWTDPARGGGDQFKGAFHVGLTKIDGVEADQYAFREEAVDWQIWIRRADPPTPLRIVITDRTQATLPQYEARLSWNTSPQLAADSFTYRPAKGVNAIRLSTLNPE